MSNINTLSENVLNFYKDNDMSDRILSYEVYEDTSSIVMDYKELTYFEIVITLNEDGSITEECDNIVENFENEEAYFAYLNDLFGVDE